MKLLQPAMRRYLLALVGAAALCCPALAASSVEHAAIARGRALFEKKCARCHSLERSFDASDDRPARERDILRMIRKGAALEKSQIAPILEYMSARSAFETRCNGCHDLERPLAAIKNLEQWQATVQRMAARKPGLLTDADAEAIARFLSLTTAVETGTPASEQR